jgi:large subunit ribosomal protein L2
MFKLIKFIVKRVKKKLTIGFSKRSGRNFFGRKTIFTQSGGVFVKLRIINFFRNLNLNGILLTIEKDINRTGFIGLICYENGLYNYILLADKMMQLGLSIKGFTNQYIYNSSTFLLNIPNGVFVHHIESIPGKGANLVRSAGCCAFLISNDLN